MQQLIQALVQGASAKPAASDRDVADQTAHALTAAVAAAKDPELKAALSTALAALHKYLVAEQKEQDGMMAGKATPRAMRRAYGH